jgi:hydrogenase expression/formation protein HypD
MKYVQEYRDADRCRQVAEAIAATVTRPHTIMEICGGQTHSIVKHGLDQLLPEQITLVHGPGCPVCVTPIEAIDRAIAIAQQPDVIFCSFGDMLRVPGSTIDLLSAKAQGADVRIVYSPLDAVSLAAEQRDRQIVFFAVGFETTAPATALAVRQAQQLGLDNFSLLVSHVLVPPAMSTILAAPDCQVQGFLAAGHVCTVTGFEMYHAIADRFQVPIIVTGFEPLDILHGVYHCVQQLEAGTATVENCYARSVREPGNAAAIATIEAVFQVAAQSWRGIGELPNSGLELRSEYAQFDARRRFKVVVASSVDDGVCQSGEILRGLKKPHECPAFGEACTPDRPLGAPMVSSEGACAAYYRYRERQAVAGSAVTPVQA